MRRIWTPRLLILALIAALAVTFLAGCASHDAIQTPPGVKVGPALTQTQVQAIQKKRAGQMGTSTQ